MRKTTVSILFFMVAFAVVGQNGGVPPKKEPRFRLQDSRVVFPEDSIRYDGRYLVTDDGDTIPHVLINNIIVVSGKVVNSPRDVRKYWRLAVKVKKVYPYAQKAAELLREADDSFRNAKTPKERKKYVKQVENELFKKYGSQIKRLTISEGRILIKLIDRETKNTSYELIKEFKGGIAAFFWQGIARLFGHNLKDEYDPIVEDRMIEEIIFFIETGVL